MDLRADVSIPFPRPLVYATYRDRLTELVPYLPNVRAIEVRSRTERDGVIELVNVWHGGGEVPAAARAFLSEAMLSWTDYATWRAADWATDWRTETHSFREAVRAEGTNRFFEDGPGATRLEIRGAIAIDPTRIRGVPAFLARRVAPAVEEFLVGRIKPNLVEVGQGVARLLREQGAGGAAG